MPENTQDSLQDTELNNSYNSVSQNDIDNELLRDISNELKVINENEILIIHRLDNMGVSVSDNDIKALKNDFNKMYENTLSENDIEYDSIIYKEFSEYSLTESFLLIMCILLFILLVVNFLKGKKVY